MNKHTNFTYLREPQVFDKTKLSKTTRWRLERDGKFPKRRRLSANAVGWLAAEIDQWLESRAIVIEGVK